MMIKKEELRKFSVCQMRMFKLQKDVQNIGNKKNKKKWHKKWENRLKLNDIDIKMFVNKDEWVVEVEVEVEVEKGWERKIR